MMMDGIQAVQAVKDGKSVQYYCGFKWEKFDKSTDFTVGRLLGEPNPHGYIVKYRIEPIYIVFNGIKVPAPLSEEPEIGTNYWFFNPQKPNGLATGKWEADAHDHAVFANVGIYLQEDHVVQVRDAYRAFLDSKRVAEDG